MCFRQAHKKGNMAKFKCNHSGNVFEFTTEHDIETMREHSEYSEELPETKPKKVKQDASTISRNNTNTSGKDNSF